MQDQWLYFSGAGLLISALLWPYLLIQFRHSHDGAVEEPRTEEPSLHPLIPPAPAAAKPAAKPLPVIDLKPAPEPQPAARPASESTRPPQVSNEASAGAAFLREMKNQLDGLQKEMKSMKEQMSAFGQKHDSEFDVVVNQLGEIKQNEKDAGELKKQMLVSVQKHESQFEALLNQWKDMKSELHELKAALSAVQPAPAHPLPVEAVEKAPEPAPQPLPQIEAPPPQSEPDEPQAAAPPQPSVELELPQPSGVPKDEAAAPRLDFGRDTVILPPPDEKPAAAEPAAAAPPPPKKRRGPIIIDPDAPADADSSSEEEPPSKRRGPVWPV